MQVCLRKIVIKSKSCKYKCTRNIKLSSTDIIKLYIKFFILKYIKLKITKMNNENTFLLNKD